jgi:transcriptional regulator with XRE-family HTH domain
MAKPEPPAYLDLVTTIGERVKLARTTLQLTQTELARRLGLSQGYISAVENGRDKANLEIVVGLLMYFPEINPDWLTTGRGEIKRAQKFGVDADNLSLDTDAVSDILKIFDQDMAKLPEEDRDRLYSRQHYYLGLMYRIYMMHYQAFIAKGVREGEARAIARVECERLDKHEVVA